MYHVVLSLCSDRSLEQGASVDGWTAAEVPATFGQRDVIAEQQAGETVSAGLVQTGALQYVHFVTTTVLVRWHVQWDFSVSDVFTLVAVLSLEVNAQAQNNFNWDIPKTFWVYSCTSNLVQFKKFARKCILRLLATKHSLDEYILMYDATRAKLTEVEQTLKSKVAAKT